MELTEHQIRDAKTIIQGFFGTQVADNITINSKVIEVLATMLTETKICSQKMDLVPRPSGSRPGIIYFIRQLESIARRVRSNDSSYHICKKVVAYNWGQEIQMAGMGL